MLEPASPYRDLYCLACVAIPEECRMVIEVVGPGFDTSDLLRSDLLPHERFEISLPAVDTATSLFPLPPATRTYLITQARYRESVEDRLGKVGAKAANPAFPSQVATDPTDLRDRARQLLMQTGETLLLRHGLRYHPIPKPLLRRFIAGVVEMLSGLERRAIRLGAVTFSGTFTTRKRLVYWDFFPADTKQGLRLFRAEA
jgi:hypothetical protein